MDGEEQLNNGCEMVGSDPVGAEGSVISGVSSGSRTPLLFVLFSASFFFLPGSMSESWLQQGLVCLCRLLINNLQ